MADGFVFPVPVGSGGGGLSDGDYGDITVSGGGAAMSIDDEAVTLAKLELFPELSVIANDAAGPDAPPVFVQGTVAGTVLRISDAGTDVEFDTVSAAGLASNAVTTAKILDNNVTFAKMENILTDSLIGRDTAGTGDPENIGLNATLAMDGGGNLQRAALTGDIVAAAGSNTTVLRDSFGLSVIGRTLNSIGAPADITGSADLVLRVNTAGTALLFGTVNTGGYADDSVSDAKLRNSGACSVIGRSANSSGDPADISAGSNGMVLARRSDVVGFSTANTAFTLYTEMYCRQSLYGTAAASPPSLGALAPNSNSSLNDAENHVSGFQFTDGTVTWLHWGFIVPAETAAASDVTPRLLFWVNGAPGAVQVDIDIIGAVFSDNDASSGGTTFSVGTIVSLSGYGAGDFAVVDLTALGISISPGQYIQGVVQRDATAGNASDTYADLIRMMGIQFKGTRAVFV